MVDFVVNNKLFSILLFLYGIMLYTALMGVNVYFQLFFLLFIILLLPLKRKYFDFNSKMIVFFSFFYSIIFSARYYVESNTLLLLYILAPISFYIFGKYVVEKLKTSENIDWFIVGTVILLGLFLYLFVFYDIKNNGYISIVRDLNVFGGDSISATLLGLNVSLGFVGLPIYIIKKKNNIKSWLYLFAFISSVLTVTHMLNRTGVIIAVSWSFLFFLFYFYRKSFSKSLLLIMILGVLLWIIYMSGIIDESIFNKYSTRNEEEGLEGRSSKWLLALGYIFDYPFGWEGNHNLVYSSYVHNIWLDIARVSGVLPMIIFVMLTIKSLYNSYKLLSLDKNFIYISIVGLNFCFLCTFMVEPVIEGCPLYFYLWFMLCGIQESILLKLSCNN